MANNLKFDLSNRSSGEISCKMVNALIISFRLSDTFVQAICADQKCLDVEQALHKWLLSILMFPDQPFAEALMPLISQKFNRYLEELRRNSPWIQ